MKIFVQSPSLEEIRQAADAGLADGVALTADDLVTLDGPAVLRERILEIAETFALPVCVPVSALSGPDIYRDARELTRGTDRVIVQIPFVEDAVTPIRKLVADGVRVCATYIYSGAQAFLAAKIGATMVMVQVHDLDAHGRSSGQVVGEIRRVLDQSNDVECDLVVSAPSSATHLTECLLAGADIACASPEALRALMVHSLTDRGVDRFLSDLSRRHKPRSV